MPTGASSGIGSVCGFLASASNAASSAFNLAVSASSLATTSPPSILLVPRIEPPNRPPAIPASRYSARASSSSMGSPAWARSISCCPISVGTSAKAPVPTPLTPRVNMPPPPTTRLVSPRPPINKRSATLSNAA